MKPHDRAEVWMEFAYDDLRAGRLVMSDGVNNLACFHAQQAAEKSLKALLKASGYKVMRTHNLSELFVLCSKAGFDIASLEHSCFYLDRFYAPTRYPDAFPGSLSDRMPSKEETSKALELAENIYELAWKLIKSREK